MANPAHDILKVLAGPGEIDHFTTPHEQQVPEPAHVSRQGLTPDEQAGALLASLVASRAQCIASPELLGLRECQSASLDRDVELAVDEALSGTSQTLSTDQVPLLCHQPSGVEGMQSPALQVLPEFGVLCDIEGLCPCLLRGVNQAPDLDGPGGSMPHINQWILPLI
jgi:hypothetical protein